MFMPQKLDQHMISMNFYNVLTVIIILMTFNRFYGKAKFWTVRRFCAKYANIFNIHVAYCINYFYD